MKYKGRQGNIYLFECEGVLDELELLKDDVFGFFLFKEIYITSELDVATVAGQMVSYKDIQTAVSMMQILIDEGEV